MLFSALVLAAGVSAAPPAEARMPNFYRPPAQCGAQHDQVVRRIRTATQASGSKSRLLQYAVYRQVDGCAVPSPAGYHPDYLLPGAADVSKPSR